jgi:hypothetical protein
MGRGLKIFCAVLVLAVSFFALTQSANNETPRRALSVVDVDDVAATRTPHLGKHHHHNFSYDFFRIVDYHTIDANVTNYLVRAPIPVQNGTFQVQQLLDFTSSRAAELGLPPLHANTTFVFDYNLLDTCLSDDRRDIDVERSFFEENPHFGRFRLWPIWGEYVDARQLQNSTVKSKSITS